MIEVSIQLGTALYSCNMKRFATLLSLVLVATLTAPAGAAVKTITKPSAPTINSITSSPVKKGKVNLTVVVTLGADNGGAAVSGTKISAGGKSCTTKKAKTSCTIKGIKNGKAVNVSAKTKNKKGFGPGSALVTYTAGAATYAVAAATAAAPAPTVVSYPTGSFSGSGTFRVGVDVAPGTYKSSPTSDWGGYWARLACATGSLDCINANELTSGSSYVTILPTDVYFETTRMSQWIPESALTGAMATSFSGTGMYKVGFDILPGTYQAASTGSFGGYWSRMSCATGELDCVITNELTSGSAIVTILPTDVFFITNRHDTWNKIG